MIRKVIVCFKSLGRRRVSWLVLLCLWAVLALAAGWLGGRASHALLPPPPPAHDLHHFQRSTDLQHYLDNIQLLIEPSAVSCSERVVALVSSAPGHAAQRDAVRDSWGSRLNTYFVLGVDGHGDLHESQVLADNYIEAKLHGDLVVFDLTDHYQNLTLKTALMLRWATHRCNARLVLKTDDDVLVNPWTLDKVLDDHPDAPLLGYRISDAALHRDEYSKWHVPRWLLARDTVPHYLSGTAYLLRGDYIQDILTAAKKVPLINLEDIYFTYLVSKSVLNLDLVHDRRLSPYKPWFPLDCTYFSLASLHSLTPTEMAHAWAKIERTAEDYQDDDTVCGFYRRFIKTDLLLY